MARFGKAVFGLQDIEVGSEQFDKAVRIKGSDPERIARLLSGSGVQDRILDRAAGVADDQRHLEGGDSGRSGRRGGRRKSTGQAIDLVVPIVRALKDARAFEQD